MRRSRTIHALAVLALAVPASLTSWAATGPASAATLPASASVLGANGLKWTLTKCSDATHTGTKGSAVSKLGAGNVGTMKITWNKTGTTTISFTFGVAPVNLCPSPQLEIFETGTVTGGTAAAVKSMKKGQKTSVKLCQGSKGVTLVKGSKFVL